MLVVAPHPDDETLGCGAAIVRARRAGRPVHVILVSDGSQSVVSARITPRELTALRVEEAVAALGVLGVSAENLTLLGFPDAGLEQNRAAIADALRSHVARIAPSEVFAPYWVDGHEDHRAVAAVVGDLVAAGDVTCPVYRYLIWFWPRGALRQLSAPTNLKTLRRVSTGGALPAKREAMAAYRSQCENFTGEPGAWFLTAEVLSDFYTPQELFFQTS